MASSAVDQSEARRAESRKAEKEPAVKPRSSGSSRKLAYKSLMDKFQNLVSSVDRMGLNTSSTSSSSSSSPPPGDEQMDKENARADSVRKSFHSSGTGLSMSSTPLRSSNVIVPDGVAASMIKASEASTQDQADQRG